MSHFDRLRIFLTGEPAGVSYSELAVELGMSESALKVAEHRLRRKFREVLRAEIADTVRRQKKYLLLVVSG